jgi:DNA-binding GntR family transcriptional regulator
MARTPQNGSRGPATDAALRLGARKESAYDKIRQAIMTGELQPGQHLVENVLAEWCQVSRTPIREALLRLEQDALIVRTDRGLMVRERSPGEILDIYDTRIVLEAAAARSAATRHTELDIVLLRRSASRMEEADHGDENAMTSANRNFHRTMWQASHNESLTDLLTRLDSHLARYPFTTLSYPGRWVEAIAEHRAMITAVELRDAERASELTMKHFARARDIRLTLWEESHP